MGPGELTACFRDLWHHCPDDFPVFKRQYLPQEQQERERLLADYAGKLKKMRESRQSPSAEISADRFFEGFREAMHRVYGYPPEALDLILHPGMKKASSQFYARAREFDPRLDKEEIFQAMRNAWIMNGLQLLMDIPPSCTPAVLGYSLLYPYTDNLLDDPAIAAVEKAEFSDRFREWLQGKPATPAGRHEEKILFLLGMIGEQYPRELYPGVHNSLLAIHGAQARSLGLMGGGELTPGEILSISFEKGGTSVVADGYLVSGHPGDAVEKFLFGYGIWLQLFDDIQDLAEDAEAGTRTLFTQAEDPGQRSRLVNRTFHFGRRVMEEVIRCPSEIRERFGEVILYSIETMLIQSVGLNPGWFPAAYSAALEVHSPVSFRYLLAQQKKGGNGRLRLIRQLAGLQERLGPVAG